MPVNMELHNSVSFGKKNFNIDNKKAENAVYWLGENCTSTVQKGITGATGLLTQPFLDLNNKDVDEKTRKTSCAKTISRLIVGTATGIIIREACIRAASAFTKTKAVIEDEMKRAAKKSGKNLENISKNITIKPWQQFLLPESIKNSTKVSEIKKYRGAIGTYAALGVMAYTNFSVDAPLTSLFTNNIALPFVNKFMNFINKIRNFIDKFIDSFMKSTKEVDKNDTSK